MQEYNWKMEVLLASDCPFLAPDKSILYPMI
jgi:hypothetical protein